MDVGREEGRGVVSALGICGAKKELPFEKNHQNVFDKVSCLFKKFHARIFMGIYFGDNSNKSRFCGHEYKLCTVDVYISWVEVLICLLYTSDAADE